MSKRKSTGLTRFREVFQNPAIKLGYAVINSTLIILGAGCSCESGYPLANNMFPCLTRFRDSLGDEAVKLRGLVTQALDLVEVLRKQGESVDTLDTLARLIHEGKAGGKNMLERSRLVVAAKVSIAALFLSLEHEAVKKDLPGYRQLVTRVFPDSPNVGFRKAIELSRHRVLTFNYDRLFELAFRQYFPEFDGTQALYCPTVLNSGLFLVDPEKLEIDRNKFSFLKLHGSAGFYGILRWTPLLRPRGAIFKLVFGEVCSGFLFVVFLAPQFIWKERATGPTPWSPPPPVSWGSLFYRQRRSDFKLRICEPRRTRRMAADVI